MEETIENPSLEKTSEKSSQTPKKSKRSKDGRRFSDHQIKSLESIFDHETKLEPKKKLEVARDLGLHPRQVAIWFQNRRARWKSKQIEHEYRKLKANYDNLFLQFDELQREKRSLQLQLQELRDLMKNLEKVDHISQNVGKYSHELFKYNHHPINHCGSSHEEIRVNDFMNAEDEGNFTKFLHEPQQQEDDADNEMDKAMRSWAAAAEEEGEGDQEFSPLASPETWRNLSDGGMFHQSFGTSNWWETDQFSS